MHVGRVAFVNDGYPVVLPVNYQVFEGDVVFRTGIGSKLDAALRGAPLSFQVDAVDPAWEEGWSVLIRGRAQEVTGEALQRVRRRSLRPWGPGAKPRYLRVVASTSAGARSPEQGRW